MILTHYDLLMLLYASSFICEKLGGGGILQLYDPRNIRFFWFKGILLNPCTSGCLNIEGVACLFVIFDQGTLEKLLRNYLSFVCAQVALLSAVVKGQV